MNDEYWIGVFIDQTQAAMEIWTVYVLVVTLLLGFVAQKKESLEGCTACVLVVGFVIVAAANGVPLASPEDAQMRV